MLFVLIISDVLDKSCSEEVNPKLCKPCCISGAFINKFQIFPNPASNILNVYTSADIIGSQYRISDNLGRVVIVDAIQNKNTAIDISGLPRGVYYITIEKQIRKHKIIKI